MELKFGYNAMNDWEIRKFLKIVLTVQFAIWVLIGLYTMELQIPILRQLVGFIYLTFVPGILILRILKLHRLGNIETLLYTVGLSITTLMFTGFFMNTVYPFFGISGPISLTPLMITISIIVLLMCALCYVRDSDFCDPYFIGIKDLLSPIALFLCLIPFLSIFGTHLVNFHQNNILLVFLIIIISIIVILIGFDKFIHKNMYPLTVFIIAISLLYHSSLISMYLWGSDIHYELYLSNLVKMNSIWNPSMTGGCNALLSLTILAPVYSIILHLDIIWVFKVIYPFLFSLVPLGLYRVYQKQTDDKIAFFACFFFVALHTFYGEMLQLARQQIAELFFVLLILLMMDKNMAKIKRSFLFIIFGVSLVVSHYGLSYIYMFSLIFAWLILILMDNPEVQRLRDNLHFKFGRYNSEKIAGNPNSLKTEDRTISSTFVLLFVVFTLAWYIYISSSSAFDSIVNIGNHIAKTIFTDFLNPTAVQGLDMMMAATGSVLHEVHKYIHLVTQFLIFVGVITLMLNRKRMKFGREYEAFLLVFLLICFASITVPHFASSLNTSRLYQVTLFFLAPLCVIGGLTVLKMLSKVPRVSWTSQYVGNSLKVLSVFFAIFLLFNSGWVYEVANDRPTSISLNDTMDYPRFNEQEVLGAKWWHTLKSNDPAYVPTYADANRYLLLRGFDLKKVITIPVDANKISEDSDIYFGTWNIVEEEVKCCYRIGVRSTSEYFNSSDIVDGRSMIYNNGGAQVYR